MLVINNVFNDKKLMINRYYHVCWIMYTYTHTRTHTHTYTLLTQYVIYNSSIYRSKLAHTINIPRIIFYYDTFILCT